MVDIIYEIDGEKRQIESSMVVLGEDQTYTAMAKTVGLPVAIATLAILNGKIKPRPPCKSYCRDCNFFLI